MEDLAGLNFSSSNTQPKSAPPNQTRFPQSTTTFANPIPSRGLSPNYGIGLPRPSNGSTTAASRNPTASKPDSFASLSTFSGISRQGPQSKATLEQQRLAREQERKEALEKEKRDLDKHFGAEEFWEKHSRQNTPTIITTDTSRDVDLAGFSSDAPVSTASHFPPPQDDILSSDGGGQDPFDMTGFGESLSGSRTRYHTSPGHLETTNSTSDDILGILAQPVETFTKPKSPSPKPESPKPPVQEDTSDEDDSEPRDRAIAAIVEMGFSIGQATKALSQTPSGLDVQAALDNLLSRPSSSASARLERPPPGKRRSPDPLARQRQEHAQQQKDISQIAGEVGTSLLKGAGSLWKSGREKMNTLIHEYQGEQGQLDPSVPKWMRDQQRHAAGRRAEDTVTDEARALEARDDMRRPITKRPTEQRSESLQRESSSRSNLNKDRNALRKQAEEEAETAYRSSARRRPPPSRTGTPSGDPPSRTATPSSRPVEVDLFSSTTEDIIPKTPSQRPSRSQTPQIRNSPKPSTPKPQRVTPPTSDSALSSSHASRQKGSDAFKIGDYTLALTHYTSALTPLPSTHPQRMIILSNRAITNIKLGDAKATVIDCDDLLQLVGPSRGDGETVMDMDGPKNLREIWGKGILRRATALEMQEKYQDALEMWKQAVDAGIGGAQSLEGRRRCENALGVKAPPPKSVSMGRSISTPQRTPTPINQPFRSSTPGLPRKSTPRPMDTRASDNLAQHNKTMAADEEEKTRLYDTVDSKVTNWQNGKESNIRALLSSLDLILWPEAGWKKVGMAELVMVNKVKIVYMKAIAKVHPDKISTGASVEQRMIAAAVFARLNDAYTAFKEQNGL